MLLLGQVNAANTVNIRLSLDNAPGGEYAIPLKSFQSLSHAYNTDSEKAPRANKPKSADGHEQ